MKAARGFTLVEILVVIIIVGVLASMAVLSIGSDPQRLLRQEAERALAILQLASDEALLEGKEYGLLASKEGYQVVRFNEQNAHWEADSAPAFSPYVLPDNVVLEIASEGKTVDLAKLANADSQQHKQTDQDLKPALLFLSSGETTPFTLTFSSHALTKTYSLRSDGLSDIKLDSSNEH